MAATLVKCLMLEEIVEESDKGETNDDNKTATNVVILSSLPFCVSRYDKEIKILLVKTKTLYIF